MRTRLHLRLSTYTTRDHFVSTSGQDCGGVQPRHTSARSPPNISSVRSQPSRPRLVRNTKSAFLTRRSLASVCSLPGRCAVISQAFTVPVHVVIAGDCGSSQTARPTEPGLFGFYSCGSYRGIAGVRLRVRVSIVDFSGQRRFALCYALIRFRTAPREAGSNTRVGHA